MFMNFLRFSVKTKVRSGFETGSEYKFGFESGQCRLRTFKNTSKYWLDQHYHIHIIIFYSRINFTNPCRY